MATTLNMTLLLRRAAFADSCVLQAGEPGYHITTKEFKVGDGTTTWKDLPIANKTQIDAIVSAAITAHAAGYYTKKEIDDIKSALQGATSKVASDLTAEVTARTEADTALQNSINTKLASADFTSWKNDHETGHAKLASEITTEINNAVDVEKSAREQADTAINNKIGTVASGKTVVGMISEAEAAAKAHAESKASAAQSAAEATAESKDAARAQAAATNLANAVSALETKISTGDSTTLQSAKDYADGKVSAEATARENADNALDARIDKLEAFFEGADHDGETGGLKDALDTLVEIQTYIESEGAAADEMVKDIAQNASDIDALESRMGTAESTITSLGNNKLDKSTYETYINGKSMSDAQLKKYAEDEADAAQTAAITEAGKLDTALHTVISKEIDDDVAAAIAAEVTRSNDYADKAESDAIAAAVSQAAAKDATLKTAIEGTSTDTSSAKTIAGAKKYAEEKASAAQTAAVNTAASDATSKANAAKEAAISAAATDATTKANKAESNAKSYADTEIGKEKTRAEGQEAAIRSEFASADAATLTAAKNYADSKVTDAHKNYQSATVKDAAHDSATNPSFITSITIEKGHVTGATVQNLMSVLEAMEFIFDGGTAAN